MKRYSISTLQGEQPLSDYAGQTIMTTGVVIGHSRKGYFIQDRPFEEGQKNSSGIFVFAGHPRPKIGVSIQVWGKIHNFRKEDTDKPVTQLHAVGFDVVAALEIDLTPIDLCRLLPDSSSEQAAFLNSIEGMLCQVNKGARFLAPSNPFGDYVLCDDRFYERHAELRAGEGLLIDPSDPYRWLPSIRAQDLDLAPRVDVGDKLTSNAVGPLNYRAKAYQIAVQGRITVEYRPDADSLDWDTLAREHDRALSCLTLNTFNLDPKKEDPNRVNDARRDVDDDVGDLRFTLIAQDIVKAGCPDIIALQEMQDDDGAEITEVTTASKNHRLLIRTINEVLRRTTSTDSVTALSKTGATAEKIQYAYAEIAPPAGADGGQPGGNIRNSYLYNVAKLELAKGSKGEHLIRLCQADPAFADSRKPLLAQFKHRESGTSLVVVNVHLASKRQQRSLFATEKPCYDERAATRVEQARLIKTIMDRLQAADMDVYVTGDFNDTEFSETLAVFTGSAHKNLVNDLSPDQRYDYNHRGKLQVLMHGIIPCRLKNFDKVTYKVLHGNELRGVKPGTSGIKASDHAYVLASFLIA